MNFYHLLISKDSNCRGSVLKSLCDVLASDGGLLSEGQSSSVWNSAYPPQASSCLPSVSVHPDFTPSPVSFNHPDGALWADHVLSQGSLPPPATLPDSWTYGLNPQSSSSYPNVHNVYHPHPHIHTRHHHPMLHSYPTHSPALDPRFNPLLLPSVRNQNQPTASTGRSPDSEGMKTEMDPSSNSTATSVTWTPSAVHGSLEVYDSGRRCKTNVTQYTDLLTFIKLHMYSNSMHNSNFTFFLSLLQLLIIRPKQRHQFGSK